MAGNVPAACLTALVAVGCVSQSVGVSKWDNPHWAPPGGYPRSNDAAMHATHYAFKNRGVTSQWEADAVASAAREQCGPARGTGGGGCANGDVPPVPQR